MTKEQGSWWVDDPLQSADSDDFERRLFVDQVVASLERLRESESSTVVGLVGPWGSGKSTLINFVRSGLPDDRWRPIAFSPWASDSREGLVSEFYAVLAEAVDDGTRQGKQMRKKVESAAEILIPGLRAIPFVGSGVEGVAHAIRKRMKRSTTRELADLLNSEVARAKRPLIVVDDLDRLQPNELLLTLQLIRLLGRLPGVHYLLAYDEETMLDSIAQSELATSNRKRALAYLEKIVQLKLDIPPVGRLLAERALSDGLQEVLDGQGLVLSRDDIERFQFIYECSMSTALTEPRKIRRYVAQVATYLPLVGDEVDVPDFLALTLVRTEMPDFYRRLQRHGHILVRPSLQRDPQRGQLRDEWKKFLDDARYDEGAWALLGYLFPALSEDDEAADDVVRWLEKEELSGSTRVGNPEYFERYFAFGIPHDDLPDRVARQGIDDLIAGVVSDAAASLTEALRSDDAVVVDGRLSRASADRQIKTLRKLERMVGRTSAHDLPNVLLLAANYYPSRMDSSLLGTPDEAAMEWMTSILRAIEKCPAGSLDLSSFEDPTEHSLEPLCRACVRATGGEDPAGALKDLVQLLGPAATKAVTSHMAQRREASLSADVALLVRAALSWHSVADVRARITEMLERGDIQIEDVLSRFVKNTSSDGATPDSLIGFSFDQLVALFPLERLVSLVENRGEVPGEHPQVPTGWQLVERVALQTIMDEAQAQQLRPPPVPERVRLPPGLSDWWHDLSPDRFDVGAPAMSSPIVRVAIVAPTIATADFESDPETRESTFGSHLYGSEIRSWARRSAPSLRCDSEAPWHPNGRNDQTRTELRWDQPSNSAIYGRFVVDREWHRPSSLARSLSPGHPRTASLALLEVGFPPWAGDPSDSFLPLKLVELRELSSALCSSLISDRIAPFFNAQSGRVCAYVGALGSDISDVIGLTDVEMVPGGNPRTVVGIEADLPLVDQREVWLTSAESKQLGIAIVQALLEDRQARGFAPLLHRLAK